MIRPTVGRVVHFYPPSLPAGVTAGFSGPLAAIVTSVISDTRVCLAVFSPNGDTQLGGRPPIQLRQAGEAVDPAMGWCEWPPRA